MYYRHTHTEGLITNISITHKCLIEHLQIKNRCMSEAQEVGRLAVCEPINALGAMTTLFAL